MSKIENEGLRVSMRGDLLRIKSDEEVKAQVNRSEMRLTTAYTMNSGEPFCALDQS